VRRFADIALLAFDIDGTLTDATTWWGGETVGWIQRYSVRDGEAILRLRDRIPVVPISCNASASARERMAMLGLDGRWLGVSDKLEALTQVCREYNVDPALVCFVGDGLDDVGVLRKVGFGLAVADAHPHALAAAVTILHARGGDRVIEEIELRIVAESG
jgi:3-deoxy-D-manno-octulosonate 8-phosphate phosphatase (KDO 8-P phosphatase)